MSNARVSCWDVEVKELQRNTGTVLCNLVLHNAQCYIAQPKLAYHMMMGPPL